MSDQCKTHKVDLECEGGRSAHRSNWYCPKCRAKEAKDNWQDYMDFGEFCQECNSAPFRFIEEDESYYYQCKCGAEWERGKGFDNPLSQDFTLRTL